MDTGWCEIDIHGCFSLVKITFAPICMCTNNQWIWRHNTSTLHLCDITDQLWWSHNVGYCEYQIFCYWWGDLAIIFTGDFVARENHCRITSLLTKKKSVFTVTHALFYISWALEPITPSPNVIAVSIFVHVHITVVKQQNPTHTTHRTWPTLYVLNLVTNAYRKRFPGVDVNVHHMLLWGSCMWGWGAAARPGRKAYGWRGSLATGGARPCWWAGKLSGLRHKVLPHSCGGFDRTGCSITHSIIAFSRDWAEVAVLGLVRGAAQPVGGDGGDSHVRAAAAPSGVAGRDGRGRRCGFPRRTTFWLVRHGWRGSLVPHSHAWLYKYQQKNILIMDGCSVCWKEVQPSMSSPKLVRFESDPLAASTFRAQRSERSVPSAAFRAQRSERKSSKSVRFEVNGAGTIAL